MIHSFDTHTDKFMTEFTPEGLKKVTIEVQLFSKKFNCKKNYHKMVTFLLFIKLIGAFVRYV